MNGFDVALLVVATILVSIGIIKGIVRILIGVAALVMAFIMASRLHEPVADRLRWTDLPEEAVLLLSYLLIFLGVMLLGAVVAYLLRKLLKVAMLSWADRLAGAALGLVAALLLAGLVVLPVVAYSPHSDAMLENSTLAPYVAVVADLASPLVPEELSRLYRRHVQELRESWRGSLPPAGRDV